MTNLQDQIAQLEQRQRCLKRWNTIVIAALLCVGLLSLRPAAEPEIIRVRGIVVVDEEGHDRILIGAPIPTSSDRVRTDTAKARSKWARYFPERYMEWYSTYRHDMDGMLVLDDQGIDRAVFGTRVPDPNIGQRIGPSTGILINDSMGFERSGYGLLTVDGEDRMVLGMDDLNGEAAVMSVHRDGTAGFSVFSKGRTFFAGHGAKGNGNNPDTLEVFGTIVADPSGVRKALKL
ncbi:MAG: hypothetical protein KDC00_05990 [Flavobacteriales bacterium]|nr:hypothetical protein [Flavobacteriales bacterium]